MEVACPHCNGLLVNDYDNNDAWLETFKLISTDQALHEKIRSDAYVWVKDNFDANQNASILYRRFTA